MSEPVNHLPARPPLYLLSGRTRILTLRFIHLLVLAYIPICTNAQDTTLKHMLKGVQLSGYIECYGAYDVNSGNQHQRSDFLYNHTRSGELALNLGFLRAQWNQDRIRGKITLMTGTYAERILASESPIFRHAYEANIGLKISTTKNWWLDMGIMNSHLGYESAIGKDNPNLTRSVTAENAPYYETGLRASYTSPNENLYAAFLVLNGWQRIYKPDGDYYPAAGLQVTWKALSKLTLNYSNYAGDESDEEDYALRLFHNFYAVYTPTPKLSVIGEFDFGTQPDVSTEEWEQRQWFGWFGVVRYEVSEKWALAARLEQYQDESEIIVNNPYDNNFSINGYSLNVDYKPHPQALLRLEGKRYDSEQFLFENRDGNWTNVSHGITASLAVSF